MWVDGPTDQAKMTSTFSQLVLHADDLGMSPAVDEGILQGFRRGLLTSTSLLSNAPDAAQALHEWKSLTADHAAGQLLSAESRKSLDDPGTPFDLGVHLNLTQGRPLTADRFPSELLDSEGRFPGIFRLFASLQRHGRRFHEAVLAELERQVQFVCDHGLTPSHLNGHQYIEMIPAITAIVETLLPRFGVKSVRVARERSLLRTTVLRGQPQRWPLAIVKRFFAERFRSRMDAMKMSHPDVFFGTAHAGSIDLALLQQFLAAARGISRVEVALHPGTASVGPCVTDQTDGWHDPLANARPHELAMLTSPELPAMLKTAGWRLGRLSLR